MGKKKTTTDFSVLSLAGRTLFTSDWHIGADTWGRDRRDELRLSMETLSKSALYSGVENIVIGGDIFDSFRYPGREDLKFASSLFSLFFHIPTVRKLAVVDGNHDWNDMGVWPDMMFFMSGNEQEGNPKFVVAENPMFIDGGDGWISLVPHLRRHSVKGSFEETVASAVPGGNRPVLACAHMSMEGTMPELDNSSSGEPQMTRKALGNYGKNLKGAFFGHIHKVEEYDFTVPGESGSFHVPCRYIGTPLRISFSEEKHKNGGWIADFSGNAVFVETPSRELITIRAATRKEAEEQLVSIEGKNEGVLSGDLPFIRVVIESGEKISQSEIAAAAPGVADNIVVVDSKERDTEKTMADFTLSMDASVERGSISVAGMLLPYFSERLSNPDLAPFFASIGTGLLEGAPVEKIWQAMKDAGNDESEIDIGIDTEYEGFASAGNAGAETVKNRNVHTGKEKAFQMTIMDSDSHENTAAGEKTLAHSLKSGESENESGAVVIPRELMF